MRICPNCLKETDQEICPLDGFQTSERKNFKLKVADPLIGQVFLNRYQIEKLVGEGGMGKVYLAKQISIDRDVAIKILLSEHSENDIIRFQREAITVGQLQHPNTVKLYDYGETDSGSLFMAMEYIQGMTIRDCIKAGRKFTVDDVSAITKQILKSLREAHDHGIVHRDLKSSNIMLTENFGEKDFVKVLDFGIAKNILPRNEESSLTGTGFMVGTPTYMSPEQILGLQIDGRSDLYSLGLIMYEMLTHRRPPKPKNRADLIDTRPDQEFLRFDDLPQSEKAKTLYALVSKSLEKMINKRPESAATFLTMMEKVDQTGTNIAHAVMQKEREPSQKKAKKEEIEEKKKKISSFFPLIILIALIGIISIKYIRRLIRPQNPAKIELLKTVPNPLPTFATMETPVPAVAIALTPRLTPVPNAPLHEDDFITVQTIINLSFAKNLQNLFFKVDGPQGEMIEISLVHPNVKTPTFALQTEIIGDLSKNANIPILIRSKRPGAFVLSLFSSPGGAALARGMGHMAILGSDGIIPVNSVTTFLTNFAFKQNKPESFSLRCILDPYIFLRETLTGKYGKNLWSLTENVLQEEIKANANILSNVPPCQIMPHEKDTRLIPITLSIEVDHLKLASDATLNLRILREDNFYLPLKKENSNSPNHDMLPDLDFTVKKNDKFKTLRLYTVLTAGPEFGIVEIHHNDSPILSGLINLQRSAEGASTDVNSKTTFLINSLENINEYEIPCLLDHQKELGQKLPEAGVCKKRYSNMQKETTKFQISSKSLSKDILLQREDLLFFPVEIDSTNRKIEFPNYFGPAWGRLIIPESPTAFSSTIINFREIMAKDQGIIVSPIGNLILAKILENDSLTQFDLECLNFQFYELVTMATSTFQLSAETSSDILIPEWQEHFKMLTNDMPCKKR